MSRAHRGLTGDPNRATMATRRGEAGVGAARDAHVNQPETIGKYEVLGRLGRGGMAEVFLVRRPGAAGFEKKLALKRLPADQLGDELLVRSLINEARLAAQLSHPNLVQVFEFEYIDGSYCLAMEYIDGVTLEDILQRCRQLDLPIPPGLVVYIALQVLTGLDYAHTATAEDGTPLNLVHRDIKPTNIMVLRQGQVKIMDFGIARASTNVYKTTTSGGVKGTLAYMSPEQLSGETTLGPQSDLFSFGVVLYEMVTLDRLLDDQNLLLLARQLVAGLRPEARDRVDAVFPALTPVLARLLHPEVAQRYENARAVIADLRELATGASAIELADFIADLSLTGSTGEAPGTIPSSDQHLGAMEVPADASSSTLSSAVTPVGSFPRPGTSGSAPDQVSASAATLAEPVSDSHAVTGQGDGIGVSYRPPGRRRVVGLAAGFLLAFLSAFIAWRVLLPDAHEGGNVEGSVAMEPALPGTGNTSMPPADASASTGRPKAETPRGSALEASTPSVEVKVAAQPRSTDPAGRKTSGAKKRKKSKAHAGAGAGAPATPPAPPVAGKTGRLTINAFPWASLYLDGVHRGSCPLKDAVVSAGKHHVKLVDAKGNSKEFDVHVKAGETTLRIWSFVDGAWVTPNPE